MKNTNNQLPSNTNSHWDRRYIDNADVGLSWSEDANSLSLRWISELVPKTSSIVDIGAGRSKFLPTLLSNGYKHLIHVEWSQSASLEMQRNLGKQSSQINWFVGDLLDWQPDHRVDVWHDRAVFHFRIDTDSVNQYLRSLHQRVSHGGYILLATFHLDGPERCSGLPVKRYDAELMLDRLNAYDSSNWVEVNTAIWDHKTPSGGEQKFQYLLAQRH
jgi:SAM-dependent methyltransferase